MNGGDLVGKLRRASRRKQLTAIGLLSPALLLMVLAFVWPIISLLTTSVRAPEFAVAMPKLSAWLQDWDGRSPPDETAYRLVAEEFGAAVGSWAKQGYYLTYYATAGSFLGMVAALAMDETFHRDLDYLER